MISIKMSQLRKMIRESIAENMEAVSDEEDSSALEEEIRAAVQEAVKRAKTTQKKVATKRPVANKSSKVVSKKK